MKEKIHTGCSCYYCRIGKSGKNNWIRKVYHKRNRARQKEELRRYGEIVNPNFSIGYTD